MNKYFKFIVLVATFIFFILFLIFFLLILPQFLRSFTVDSIPKVFFIEVISRYFVLVVALVIVLKVLGLYFRQLRKIKVILFSALIISFITITLINPMKIWLEINSFTADFSNKQYICKPDDAEFPTRVCVITFNLSNKSVEQDIDLVVTKLAAKGYQSDKDVQVGTTLNSMFVSINNPGAIQKIKKGMNISDGFYNFANKSGTFFSVDALNQQGTLQVEP